MDGSGKLSAEDLETHLNLAIAYRDMSLDADALLHGCLVILHSEGDARSKAVGFVLDRRLLSMEGRATLTRLLALQ